MRIPFARHLIRITGVAAKIAGWGLLAVLWYKFIFSPDGISTTVNVLKIIAAGSVSLFFLCFVWDRLNLDSWSLHNEFSSRFIRMKIPYWTWAEATLHADHSLRVRERSEIINRQKATPHSSAKRFSYAAILIRDGHIVEGIGFLRPILDDPNIGQLTRKIAKSELEVLLTEIYDFDR